VVASIGITIAVMYGFEQWQHLLWAEAPAGPPLPPAAAAELAIQHQAITVLAMVLGGIVAMLSTFAAMETRPREQIVTMAFLPVPMLATMALALVVAPHRVLALALLALVMGVGTYLRKFVPRFGPRAFLYGILLFIGYFFGFLSNGAIATNQLGSVAILLWLAAAVNLVFKLAISNPLAKGRLARTRGSFRARARSVLAAAIALLEADTDQARTRASGQLHRRLGRLNETALVIDGLIADPETRGSDPGRAHELIFELELLVGNLGRATERLALAGLPSGLNSRIRGWLTDLKANRMTRAEAAALAFEDAPASEFARLTDEEANRVRYLAEAVVELATVAQRFEASRPLGPTLEFDTPVTLVFGELPGSSLVSKSTAEARGEGAGLLRRLTLDPAAQNAIRVMVAVAVAAAIGSVVSERRFYWAVLAVFITFMGTNTSGEQLGKAFSRVAGTVVGIGVGSVLAHAIGFSAWSIPVILISLGIGVYFMKVSYVVMVIGITVMVSQLYEQLGEYSNSLLLLRLAETSIGAVIAVAAALLIFPIDTRKAATLAARGYLESLAELLRRTAGRLAGEEEEEVRLSSESRGLDNATQQLVATARPLRHTTTVRRERLEHNLGLFSYITSICRNLVATVEGADDLDRDVARQAADALDSTQRRVTALEATLERARDAAPDPDGEPYEGGKADDVPEAVSRQLTADAISSGRLEHRLVQSIDRLDRAVDELGANLEGARPS
jgi:uncharacterized membrane protein YccC